MLAELVDYLLVLWLSFQEKIFDEVGAVLDEGVLRVVVHLLLIFVHLVLQIFPDRIVFTAKVLVRSVGQMRLTFAKSLDLKLFFEQQIILDILYVDFL